MGMFETFLQSPFKTLWFLHHFFSSSGWTAFPWIDTIKIFTSRRFSVIRLQPIMKSCVTSAITSPTLGESTDMFPLLRFAHLLSCFRAYALSRTRTRTVPSVQAICAKLFPTQFTSFLNHKCKNPAFRWVQHRTNGIVTKVKSLNPTGLLYTQFAIL